MLSESETDIKNSVKGEERKIGLESGGSKNINMGKHGKKQKNQQRPREKNYYYNSDNDEQQHNTYPVATLSNDVQHSDSENEDTNTTSDDNTQTPSNVVAGLPSKFSLYQQSVQVLYFTPPLLCSFSYIVIFFTLMNLC